MSEAQPLRQSNAPETLAWEPLDSEHVLACARVPYLAVKDEVLACNKGKWIEEFKRRPFACCKNESNLDIEAWFNNADTAQNEKLPNIYKIFCRVCEAHFNEGTIRPGRERVAGFCIAQFCVGGNHPLAKDFTPEQRPELFEMRPQWEVR